MKRKEGAGPPLSRHNGPLPMFPITLSLGAGYTIPAPPRRRRFTHPHQRWPGLVLRRHRAVFVRSNIVKQPAGVFRGDGSPMTHSKSYSMLQQSTSFSLPMELIFSRMVVDDTTRKDSLSRPFCNHGLLRIPLCKSVSTYSVISYR